jgi:hypothetical protein
VVQPTAYLKTRILIANKCVDKNMKGIFLILT